LDLDDGLAHGVLSQTNLSKLRLGLQSADRHYRGKDCVIIPTSR
jgi:hypothetical protein